MMKEEFTIILNTLLLRTISGDQKEGMVMKKVRIIMIWAAIFCLLFIIGCGGGGGDSQKVIAEPNLSLSAQSNNFGGVVLNNYADYEFRITNDGTYNGLVINGISSPSAVDTPFSITSNTCTPGISLAKGDSCSFIVRFAPTVAGNFSDTITVTSNDPPVRTITLTGIGQELNVWINQLTYSGACPGGTMTVDVTVTNPYGDLVPDPLLKANFKLWHNNVELLPAVFSVPQRINPDAVSVVLALDLSASLANKNSDIKLATAGNIDLGGSIEGFIDRLRGTTTDEAVICKFKDAYEFSGSFLPASSGKPALKIYVRGTTESTLAAGTALYEAVYASITKAAEGRPGQKKVVIVLSDGVADPQEGEVCGTDPDPTKNTCTQQKVIDHAKVNGVPIFTIFYVDTDFYPDASPATLQQLAEGTGGQYFNSGSGDENVLAGIFRQIMNVFGEKYVITYRPSANCSGTQIPVKVQVTSGDTPPLSGSDTKKIDLP